MTDDSISIKDILERQKTEPRFSINLVEGDGKHSGGHIITDGYGRYIFISPEDAENGSCFHGK